MSAVIQAIIDFAGQHPALAGLLVFLTAATEAIAVIGVFIPGTAILIGVGAIAGLGHLSLWNILIWAALGAIVGDGVSYWLGRRYRHRIVKLWPFSRRPDLLLRSERFIGKHGAKSVAIGRFVPALRAFVPLAAGTLGMAPARFYIANILSALAWSPAHILPGTLAGISFGLLEGISQRLAFFALVLVALAVLAAWLLRVAISRLGPALDGLRGSAVMLLSARRESWLTRPLLRLLDPNEAGIRNILLLGLILAVTILGFFDLLVDVIAHDESVRADGTASAFFQGLRTPWGDALMVVVTMLGDMVVTTSVSLVAIAWLLWRRAWRLAAGLGISLLLATGFVSTVKLLLAVPRPVSFSAAFSEFSFPSGHATMAATLYGILAWLAFASPYGRWRSWPLLCMGAFVGAIGVSRIYLAAHWPSDVAAGLFFGFGLAATFGLVFRQVDVAHLRPRGLLLACLMTLVLVGSGHVALSFARYLTVYAPREEALTISAQAWLDGDWRRLPDRRVGLEGDVRERFVLQWAGSAEELRTRLLALGWLSPRPWSAAAASAMASGVTTVSFLPALPTLHDGTEPVVMMVTPWGSADTRMNLRVWQSRIRVATPTGTHPLLLVSVVRERVWHPLGLLSIPRIDEPMADPGTVLDAGRLSSGLVLRDVQSDAGRVFLIKP